MEPLFSILWIRCGYAPGMDMMRATEPALAARIESRARAWIDEHGAEFPGDLETGVLGDSKIEEERFEDFANDAACPALDPDTGQCDLYAWRPMTCRVFGPPVRMGDGEELGHCELCFIGAGKEKVAACEMTIPYDLEAELLDEIPSERARRWWRLRCWSKKSSIGGRRAC